MNTSNSMGEFREGEIDGKQVLIFTWLSQTDSTSGEAAINSGGDDDLPNGQPLFICPSRRFGKRDSDHSFVPVVVPPQLPRIKSDHQQSDSCKLPLLPLFWCNNEESDSKDFKCGACSRTELRTSYYFCVTCDHKFHKECVASPLEFKHPAYPSLLLQLYSPPHLIVDVFNCYHCNAPTFYDMAYHFPTNKFHLCLFCAFKPISIVKDHPKRHPHTLTFFPKQAFLPCIVCGLIIETNITYVCLRCVYVVHRDCIYFPYVIRISRHPHRISFTSSLPSRNLSCGVCRRKVDNDYGAYSCNKCDDDDDYVVHSRCALRRDLWDGEELEGEPEEPEIIVDPFKRIADGIILHFSHDHHHLELKMCLVYDQHKLCQACVLPIYEGSYYSCTDGCDFILHEACANEPCKKYHPLHSSPLTLVVDIKEYNGNKEGRFRCVACQRISCGFVYETKYKDFRLCLRCASVSEPFEYQGHKHPLFLALTPEEEMSAVCQICQEVRRYDVCRKLNCIECEFVICFKCATLPFKAMYQHDKHFLMFYQVKEAKDHSEWCDVCESEIGYSAKNKGFYSCDECCTTLHVDCLLGEDMYMKPGQGIKHYSKEYQILHNNTLSRPICEYCNQRCPQKIVLKHKIYAFCALLCFENWNTQQLTWGL